MAPWLWGSGAGSFWGWTHSSGAGGYNVVAFTNTANTYLQNLTSDTVTAGTALSGIMQGGTGVGNSAYAVFNLDDSTNSNSVWSFATNSVYSTAAFGVTHGVSQSTGDNTFGFLAFYEPSSPNVALSFEYVTLAVASIPAPNTSFECQAYSSSTIGHYGYPGGAAGTAYNFATRSMISETYSPLSPRFGSNLSAFATTNDAMGLIGLSSSSASSLDSQTRDLSADTFVSGPSFPIGYTSSNGIFALGASGNKVSTKIYNQSAQSGYPSVAFDYNWVSGAVTSITSPYQSNTNYISTPFPVSSVPGWL